MSDSLLPPNASDLELAVEKVLSRTEQIPVTIDTLWNPETALESTLPWLAWALSIDAWRSEWPADIKRSAIAASPNVHRIKGTVGAVRDALDALGVDIDVVEWWQNGGSPYTASVVAYASRNLNPAGQTLLTPDLQAQIWDVIEKNKPVRVHLDMTVGVSAGTQSSICGAVTSFTLSRDSYELSPYAEILSGAFCVFGSIEPSHLVNRMTMRAL